jgi:hypothetical protein
VLFQNTSGDTLAYITDEGTTGSLKIKPGIAPSNTTNKLYNVGGNLHWGNLPLSHMWNKNGSHVYYNDGKVGIGEMAPIADLEVNGVNGILFEGTFGSGSIPKEGSGNLMMWYPKKAAFRAGYVEGTQWDDINIGFYSMAIGRNTKASESHSTAMGSFTTADGQYSTAMGNNTTASGNYSTAMGIYTRAGGDYSTAMGSFTTAGGDYSTAMGYITAAGGDYSIAMGRGIEVSGLNSVGIGLNDQSGTIINQSNTMAIMGGKVGIGEVAPSGDLEVNGIDGVLFNGTLGIGTIPTTAIGTRLMWYPKKGAFRVGTVGSTIIWNDINIGEHSVAMGLNTKASNYASIAFGAATTAGGQFSTAFGNSTTASGQYSTAMGRGIEVSGSNSVGIGLNAQIGTVVSQSNTMAIMGGKVGIGDISPEATLEIHSSGTTEDPLRVRVGSATKFRLWASNGSVSMGANVVGPDDGLLVRGNIVPRFHKDVDLGADGTAWDDIYYDDLYNQGASAFDGRVLTEEIIEFPPLPKKPGSFDYLTERGDVELDPASMPPGLADENSLLTDEITSYNYKVNYEQQLMIEMLRKQVKELEKRLNELEKILKD